MTGSRAYCSRESNEGHSRDDRSDSDSDRISNSVLSFFSSSHISERKLARFRQLMDAKRLDEEAMMTPSSLLETGPPVRSASSAPRPTTTTAMTTTKASELPSKQSSSSAGAKSWPRREQPGCHVESGTTRTGNDVVGLDLNGELEREHRSDAAAREEGGKKKGAVVYNNKKKENTCPNNSSNNNFSAMKQIMKQKRMANAARKELDDSGAKAGAASTTTTLDDGMKSSKSADAEGVTRKSLFLLFFILSI